MTNVCRYVTFTFPDLCLDRQWTKSLRTTNVPGTETVIPGHLPQPRCSGGPISAPGHVFRHRRPTCRRSRPDLFNNQKIERASS